MRTFLLAGDADRERSGELPPIITLACCATPSPELPPAEDRDEGEPVPLTCAACESLLAELAADQ